MAHHACASNVIQPTASSRNALRPSRRGEGKKVQVISITKGVAGNRTWSSKVGSKMATNARRSKQHNRAFDGATLLIRRLVHVHPLAASFSWRPNYNFPQPQKRDATTTWKLIPCSRDICSWNGLRVSRAIISTICPRSMDTAEPRSKIIERESNVEGHKTKRQEHRRRTGSDFGGWRLQDWKWLHELAGRNIPMATIGWPQLSWGTLVYEECFC